MKVILIIVAAVAGLYLASLLYLAMSVGMFTKYWKQKNAKPTPKNALIYVALGDSAAQGVGAYTADKGYVGQFAERLQSKENRPVKIVNLSKSGAKIQDVINDQIPELNKIKADVITLDIGGNDIAVFDAKKFRAEYTNLVSMLPDNTLVAEVPYFGGRTQLPLFGSGLPEQSVLIANKIIGDATRGGSVILVPLHNISKERNGRRIWNYAPDYFHPSSLGYRAWTDAFWDTYCS